MSSTWGNILKLSIFGESHGPAVGMVLDGLPAGEKIDLDAVQVQMDRRAPGLAEPRRMTFSAVRAVWVAAALRVSGRSLARLHRRPAAAKAQADTGHVGRVNFISQIRRAGGNDFGRKAVIAAAGYVPDLDMDNPSSSVFCSHGAGTIIPWNQVSGNAIFVCVKV